MPHGGEIQIRQTSNDYDSVHETRWGGDCPGENIVACTDDPDTKAHRWVNQQGQSQRVYVIIDAYGGESGSFTLRWSATPPPTPSPTPPTPTSCSAAVDLSLVASPHSGSTHGAPNSVHPLCGIDGPELV